MGWTAGRGRLPVVHLQECGQYCTRPGNRCARLLQLEEEQRKVREEQQQHQEQLANFLTQFQEEVQKVESLQQQRVQDNAATLQGDLGGVEEPRSLKLLVLPSFSGADPVPKDKASCEQWVW